MTCIFQHSAVTELEDTHTVLVSADSMHSGYKQHMKDKMVVCFLNLHAFHRVYAIRMMLRCKVECMSHIGAMQGSMHAAGRLGDTQLVYTLLKMHSSHNRTIAYIPYTCFAATFKEQFLDLQANVSLSLQSMLVLNAIGRLQIHRRST